MLYNFSIVLFFIFYYLVWFWIEQGCEIFFQSWWRLAKSSNSVDIDDGDDIPKRISLRNFYPSTATVAKTFRVAPLPMIKILFWKEIAKFLSRKSDEISTFLFSITRFGSEKNMVAKFLSSVGNDQLRPLIVWIFIVAMSFRERIIKILFWKDIAKFLPRNGNERNPLVFFFQLLALVLKRTSCENFIKGDDWRRPLVVWISTMAMMFRKE